MLRNPWRTAATVSVTAVVSSACLSYLYHSRIKSNPSQDSFDIPVRSKLPGPDGRRTVTTQSLPLLTMAAIEDRIKQHASLRSTLRPGGIIWNEATAQLASNNPIEDAHASSLNFKLILEAGAEIGEKTSIKLLSPKTFLLLLLSVHGSAKHYLLSAAVCR